jgi:hypothetical protein
MRVSQKFLLSALVCLLLATVGCAKYKITHELESPIPIMNTCKIGSIVDELPAETPEHERPSWEDISTLENYLMEEFDKREIMKLLGSSAETDFEIQGSILEYKKGSGVLRFFIGFGAGNAKVLLNLKLVNMSDGATVFGGNFSGTVSSWEESGDKIFKQVSKDFTKQLEKRLKKLRKEQDQA